jgi:alpha-galactosidase
MESEVGWEQYLKGVAEGARKLERAVLDEDRPITETFEPKQSDEQAVPVIDSLANDTERLFQVNIPNQGHIIKDFPENLVIECQGVVSGVGIRGVGAFPFPPKLMAGAMIPRWHRAELMVDALRTGDRNMLLLYLLQDHRTRSLGQAEALLDEWLTDPRNEHMARLFGAKV